MKVARSASSAIDVTLRATTATTRSRAPTRWSIVTEWNEFREPDFERMRKLMRQPVIFDGRNLYNPEQMRAQGFTYYSMGGHDRASVLVTGGAGYIGSHAVKALRAAGHRRGRLRRPVGRPSRGGARHAARWSSTATSTTRRACARAIREHGVDAVMHFAAWLSVGDSVTDPAGYYDNNVGGRPVGARRDGGGEGAPLRLLLDRAPCSAIRSRRRSPKTHPTAPINAYGADQARDRARAAALRARLRLRSIALRYFNAAGADPDGELGEDHAPEIHVIPRAIDAALGRRDRSQVFGDDYDDARRHLPARLRPRDRPGGARTCCALEALRGGGASATYNLGNGAADVGPRGASTSVERVTGRKVPLHDAARAAPGDPGRPLSPSSERIRADLGLDSRGCRGHRRRSSRRPGGGSERTRTATGRRRPRADVATEGAARRPAAVGRDAGLQRARRRSKRSSARVLAVPMRIELIVVDDVLDRRHARHPGAAAAGAGLHAAAAAEQRRQGRGAAPRLRAVTGDLVVIQDADLEYSPEEYPAADRAHLRRAAPTSSTARGSSAGTACSCSRTMLGNRLLTLVTNVLYNTMLTDMETCYKVMRTDVLRSMTLQSNGFGIEPEITAKIFKRRYRVYEVPITYDGRGYDEGKKITWRDGVRRAVGAVEVPIHRVNRSSACSRYARPYRGRFVAASAAMVRLRGATAGGRGAHPADHRQGPARGDRAVARGARRCSSCYVDQGGRRLRVRPT